MKLFSTFVKSAPNRVFASIILGAIAGVSYSLLIPLVLNSLEYNSDGFETVETVPVTLLSYEIANFPFALLFLLTCFVVVITRTGAQVLLTRVSMNVTSELRCAMYRRIADTQMVNLEKQGEAKLVAALTTDVPMIIDGGRALPDILTNVITLVSMLSYLFYLNPEVFWFSLKCIFLGVITYQLPLYFSNKYFYQSREYTDKLHYSIRALMRGAKELKLNQQKRSDFFDRALYENESQVLTANKTGHTIMNIAVNYGENLSFFVIGAIAFIFVNYHSISIEELVAVLMVILYTSFPIGNLLMHIPSLALAKVSLNKFNSLFEALETEDLPEKSTPVPKWQSLYFKDVCFSYAARDKDQKQGFAIGPVNLQVNKGEITFIVGGNGSGKSTLCKLLTMHYLPEEGQISLGDQLVTRDNLRSARNDIFSIYSDYFLFDKLYGQNYQEHYEAINKYLKAFDLDKKVTLDESGFSSLDLSDGQKRRLALLVGYIEDKELYLFDEWAADQDPYFKDVFYNDILTDLKNKGKAVVVISHDDRYFEKADRIFVMQEGKLLTDADTGHKDVLRRFERGSTS